MLEVGNYVAINKGKFSGHIVLIKSILSYDLISVYHGEENIQLYSDEIRFIELSSDILLKLKDPEYPGQLASRLKVHEYDLHTKEDWILDLRGKKFYLHGFLQEKISIWSFGNIITIHYLHQLQNLVKLLNPEIDIILQ